MESNIALEREVEVICDGLKRLFDVERLIVFGIKKCQKNNCITDLDICVVANVDYGKNDLLKKAYLEIDSDVPFDLFVYTPSEWESLLGKSESFASRIARKGQVVYEKKQLP